MKKRTNTGTAPGDFFVGCNDKDGNVTTNSQTAAWTAFLNGVWQKEKPTAKGIYPIADRNGTVAGEAMFQSDCEGNVFSPTHDNWDGWFFSHPMPQIPNRPPKEWPDAPVPERPMLRIVRDDAD